MYVCIQCVCLVSTETRRGCQVPKTVLSCHVGARIKPESSVVAASAFNDWASVSLLKCLLMWSTGDGKTLLLCQEFLCLWWPEAWQTLWSGFFVFKRLSIDLEISSVFCELYLPPQSPVSFVSLQRHSLVLFVFSRHTCQFANTVDLFRSFLRMGVIDCNGKVCALKVDLFILLNCNWTYHMNYVTWYVSKCVRQQRPANMELKITSCATVWQTAQFKGNYFYSVRVWRGQMSTFGGQRTCLSSVYPLDFF